MTPAVKSRARRSSVSVVLGGSVARAATGWPGAPTPEQHAQRAGDHGEDQALDEELADDPGVRGAERSPDGDFLVACGQASEKERRDVGAGDQQHEADGAEQRVEGGPQIADQGADVRSGSVVLLASSLRGELLAGAAADRGELGRGLLQRDAGPQPGDRLRKAGARLNLHRRQAADFEDARRETCTW